MREEKGSEGEDQSEEDTIVEMNEIDEGNIDMSMEEDVEKSTEEEEEEEEEENTVEEEEGERMFSTDITDSIIGNMDGNNSNKDVQLPAWGSVINSRASNVSKKNPSTVYTSARSKYSSDRIACFHCQHSGGSILAGKPGSHILQPATCQRCHRVCGRVFGPHPYVQKDFSGNLIKICNRCFDQWILHRKEASLKEMRLFEDELNEEICCLCSDCPEADLILCESCPRSFCVDCLKKVLTAEEYLDMMRADDWICLACAGDNKKDNRHDYIKKKQYDKLNKAEEELMEISTGEQEQMIQATHKLNELIGPIKRPPRKRKKGLKKEEEEKIINPVPDKISLKEFIHDDMLNSSSPSNDDDEDENEEDNDNNNNDNRKEIENNEGNENREENNASSIKKNLHNRHVLLLNNNDSNSNNSSLVIDDNASNVSSTTSSIVNANESITSPDPNLSSPDQPVRKKSAYQPKNLDANMVAVRTGKRGRPRLISKEEAKAYDVGSTAPTTHYSQHNKYFKQREMEIQEEKRIIKEQKKERKRLVKEQKLQQKQIERQQKQQQRAILREQQRQRQLELQKQRQERRAMLAAQAAASAAASSSSSKSTKNTSNYDNVNDSDVYVYIPPSQRNKRNAHGNVINPRTVVPIHNNKNSNDNNNDNQYTLLCDHFQYYRTCPECKIESSGYKYYNKKSLKRKIDKLELKTAILTRKLEGVEDEVYCSTYVNFKSLGLRIKNIDPYREPDDITDDDEDMYVDSDDEDDDNDDDDDDDDNDDDDNDDDDNDDDDNDDDDNDDDDDSNQDSEGVHTNEDYADSDHLYDTINNASKNDTDINDTSFDSAHDDRDCNDNDNNDDNNDNK